LAEGWNFEIPLKSCHPHFKVTLDICQEENVFLLFLVCLMTSYMGLLFSWFKNGQGKYLH